MRRTLVVVLVVLAFGCREAPRPGIPRSPKSLGALELGFRPAGRHVYQLTADELVAVEPRGRGVGRMHAEIKVRARLATEATSGPARGTLRLRFESVEVTALGPRSDAAATAARGLAGASVTLEADTQGNIARLEVQAPPGARALATRLARAISQLGPSLPKGLKGPGSRWGQSQTAQLPLPGGVSVPVAFTANYVFQGTGGRSPSRRCVLVHLDLNLHARAPIPGQHPGAFNTSGKGRGETCLEPQTGVLREGNLQLTVRSSVGLRGGARPLHLEHTVRLRLWLREDTGGAG